MGIYAYGGKVADSFHYKKNAIKRRKALQKKYGHETSYRVAKVPSRGEVRKEYGSLTKYVIIAKRKRR